MTQNFILKNNQIEKISQILSSFLTGSQITNIFSEIKELDTSGELTKWRRIYGSFTKLTEASGSSNSFLRFVKTALSPINFVNKKDEFQQKLLEVNQILAFSGLILENDGEYKTTPCVSTIDEVKNRLDSLKSKLERNKVHPSILKYCNEELLEDNYFHAIFEASKSLSDKIRTLTNLTSDGSKLIDEAFSIKQPYLILNSLQTESDKNLQIGLASMLKGINSMVRNVTAHTPKIKWIVNEEDALDVLIVISYLHKRLDECDVVRMKEDSNNG